MCCIREIPLLFARKQGEMRTCLVYDRDCGIGFATIDDKRSCFAYVVPFEHGCMIWNKDDTGMISVSRF